MVTAVRFALVTLALGSLAGVPGPAAAVSPGPEAFLPADPALILVIEHPRELAAAWPRSPLGALLNDRELLSALVRREGVAGDSSADGDHTSLGEDIDGKVKAATGRSLGELCAGVEGPLVFVIDDLAPMVSGDPAGEPVHWGMLARGMDPALHESLSASLRAGTKGADGDARAPGWAEAGPWRLLASPPSYLHELAASAAKGTTETPLADDPGYRELREAHPDADIYASIHLDGLAPALEAQLDKGIESKPEAEAMGVDAAGVIDALALDAIEGITYAITVRPEETRVDQEVIVAENRGLVSLFAYLPGPCLRPNWIPENAVMAWSDRFDILAFYRGLIGIVKGVVPGFGALAETQLRQLALSAGADLERDVLGRLGPDGFTVYVRSSADQPSPGGPMAGLAQAGGCSSTDPAGVAETVKNIIAAVGADTIMAWDSREVGGVTVQSLGNPGVGNAGGSGKPSGFSYAVTDDLLLLASGDPSALDAVLRARAGHGKGLWGRKDLAPLFSLLPQDASAIGYADLGAFFDRPNALGRSVFAVVKTDRGFSSTSRMFPPAR